MNTDELFDLREQMDRKMRTVVTEDLPVMLDNSRNRVIELLQYNVFTQEDLIDNAKVFEWVEKIPKIYKEHLSLIDEKRLIFKKNLNVTFFFIYFFKKVA